MKIYIASNFERRNIIRPYRDILFNQGHDIVASWLDEIQKSPHMNREIFWKKLALKDLAEIKSADLLILDGLEPTVRGGREVECGAALMTFQQKLVYLIGPVRNVFHTLADARFESWDDLICYMEMTHAVLPA